MSYSDRSVYRTLGYSTVVLRADYDDHYRLQPAPADVARLGLDTEWRSIKWPRSLTHDDRFRLTQGWTLRGGFAATEGLAIQARRRAAMWRLAEIRAQLRELEAFMEEAGPELPTPGFPPTPGAERAQETA